MTRCTAPYMLLALLLLVPGCGFADFDEPSGGGSGGPPGPTMSSGEFGEALAAFGATNAMRQAAGIAPLQWDDTAAHVAYTHSADMRVRAFYDHLNPDGEWVTDRMAEAGILYWTVGENLWRAQPPADGGVAVQTWMGSPAHRAAILDDIYTHIGIGLHTDGARCWWTQVFYTPR